MIFNINVLNILQIKKQSFKENVHYFNFNQTLNIYITSLKLINMKKYLLISLFILILTSTIAVSAVDFENTTIKGLNITTDYDGALSEAQSQNKSIVLIFDQASCQYCEMLKENVLSNSTVQKELNENYIVVLVDINKNPKIANKYKVFGTPIIQFLDSKGNETMRIEGYVESDEFLNSLKEI